MSKQKKSNVPYFNENTEKAIQQYNKETDINKKNDIFENDILYPLLKLSEYLINKMHLIHLAENGDIKKLQYEIIDYVLEKLNNINPNKGKAFSYFHIVIRNYLIGKSKKNHTKMTNKIDLNYFDSMTFFDDNHYYIDSDENHTQKFIMQFIGFINNNINLIYTNEHNKKIVSDILNLFFDSTILNKINKRELYSYIKKKHGVNTKTITDVLKKIKHIYIKANENFNKDGIIHSNELLKMILNNNIKIFKT